MVPPFSQIHFLTSELNANCGTYMHFSGERSVAFNGLSEGLCASPKVRSHCFRCTYLHTRIVLCTRADSSPFLETMDLFLPESCVDTCMLFLPLFCPFSHPRKPSLQTPISWSLSPLLAVLGTCLYATFSRLIVSYYFIICGLMLSSDYFTWVNPVSSKG